MDIDVDDDNVASDAGNLALSRGDKKKPVRRSKKRKSEEISVDMSVPLRNIGSDKTASLVKAQNTSLNNFSKYLKVLQSQADSEVDSEYNDITNYTLSTIPKENFTVDLMGKYADYLCGTLPKYYSANNYLSRAFTILKGRFTDIGNLPAMESAHTRNRKRMKKTYVEKCNAQNTLTKSQNFCTWSDYSFNLEHFYDNGDWEKLELTNGDWNFAGRISEVILFLKLCYGFFEH